MVDDPVTDYLENLIVLQSDHFRSYHFRSFLTQTRLKIPGQMKNMQNTNWRNFENFRIFDIQLEIGFFKEDLQKS